MALALDATSLQTTNSSATITRTHTPVGTPTGVAVRLGWVDTGGRTISSVTYGGVGLTQIGSTQGGSFWKTAIFGSTTTPASGAQTVTATFSAALSHGGTLCCTTVTGGASTALSGSGGATGSVAAAGGTISGTANGEIAIDVLSDNGNPVTSYGAGQTEDINTAPTSGLIFGSYASVTGSSQAMTDNINTGGNVWAWSGASFAVASNSGGGPLINGGGLIKGTLIRGGRLIG